MRTVFCLLDAYRNQQSRSATNLHAQHHDSRTDIQGRLPATENNVADDISPLFDHMHAVVSVVDANGAGWHCVVSLGLGNIIRWSRWLTTAFLYNRRGHPGPLILLYKDYSASTWPGK